jgi:hypothetical protein
VATTGPGPALAEEDGTRFRLRLWELRPYDDVLALTWIVAVLMVAMMLFAAAPLGHLLRPASGFHFFPSVRDVVHPKPAEQMRYLLAVAFVLALGLLIAYGGVRRMPTHSRLGIIAVRLGGLAGRATIVGVAIWAWWAQFHYQDGQPPTTHFGNGDLVTAVVVAAGLVAVARWRPAWTAEQRLSVHGEPRWLWVAVAVILTVCWLLPSVFRAENLAAASESVTYHLQFTFDDFAAVVNGQTPLVSYTEQFASLMPFLAWPALRVGGTLVGTFTVTMCCLSLLGLLAIQRVFALVTRSERLALILYVPFLATSLFFILRSGSELFSWASYYAEFPMRYAGPYALLWLCIRHLDAKRPRSPAVVFAFAGLVVLNNIEFGLPALGAVAIAMFVGKRPESRGVLQLARAALIGLASAFVVVCVVTLAWAGALPQLSRLTEYSRIFAEGGYLLLHTPVGGLYLILYMTFAAALVIAALRYRDKAEDRTYTAALAFSGVLGLGAGDYYTGRTNPAGLVVLFSVWAISVLLLGLLAVRVMANPGPTRRKAPSVLLGGLPLVACGLVVSSIAQFPAPWTQLQRIASSSPPPRPFDVAPAVNLVRRTASRGESVLVLMPLGHVVAIDAGVTDVSPYSNPDNIVTYGQLEEVMAALGQAHGTRVYVDAGVYPEISRALAADGFNPVYSASGMTEWQWRH